MSNKWLERQRLREAEEAETRATAAEHMTITEIQDALVDAPLPDTSRPEQTYTWVKDDNIWDVARRLGFEAYELMEHNDIDNQNQIQPGDVLHLPIAMSKPPERKILYEVLPEPRPMHVSKEGGAKKWSFGFAKSWDDIKGSGFYPEHTNVVIVAIAHVPLVDKSGQAEEAAYYMDALALGDYRKTERVRYTIGFSWSDLSEGQYERPIIQVPESEPTKEPEKLEHNKYKDTFQSLTPPELCTVFLPKGMDFIMVREYDDRQPNLKIPKFKELKISGTFEKDGVKFGRLLLADKYEQGGYYFGIPLDYLQSNADVYNPQVDAPTRLALNGAHTWSERLVSLPLSRVVNSPRFKQYKNKKKGS